MKKTLAAFLVLMITALANGFQSSTEWVKHTSEAGRYSVLFPRQPRIGTNEATDKTGGKLTQYTAQSIDADSVYSVAYADILPGKVYSLDDARNDILNAAKGSVLKEEAISLGGSPGKEIKISAKSGEFELLLRARYYTIGGRIYLLQHVFPKSLDTPATAIKTARFFDSFKAVISR